jgi:hypothetical protein
VIDTDLGQSGRDASARNGFQELVAEVCLGHVGIVFGYQVSRLARNNRDWYTLLDLASVFDTLIADSDGVYDPRLYNDRLLLGMKRPAAYSTSCSTCDCPSCRLEAALLDRIVAARMIIAHACTHHGVGATLRRPLSRLIAAPPPAAAHTSDRRSGPGRPCTACFGADGRHTKRRRRCIDSSSGRRALVRYFARLLMMRLVNLPDHSPAHSRLLHTLLLGSDH